MPGFKFELSQLIMVPGKNQQGRVASRAESVDCESEYQVKWLDDDLNVYTETFKESDIVSAQYPEEIAQSILIHWDALKRASRERTIAKSGPVISAALERSKALPRRPRKPRPKSSARRSRSKIRGGRS